MQDIELQHVLNYFKDAPLIVQKKILGKFIHTFSDSITIEDLTNDTDLAEQLHNLMELRISLVTHEEEE